MSLLSYKVGLTNIACTGLPYDHFIVIVCTILEPSLIKLNFLFDLSRPNRKRKLKQKNEKWKNYPYIKS